MRTIPSIPDAARSFYDAAASRGLADYVHGNRRVDAAIKHTLRSIPQTPGLILDIGCGIGRSSWEIARHFPSASILAIDLSPKRIELARMLFPSPNVTYETLNVLEPSTTIPNADAIVMLDVYEHISRQDRPRFHQFVRDKLNAGGVWVLTCPTVRHQEYLRKNDPAGLQPVDEDVTKQDLESAAADIHGTLTSFQNVDIWKPEDYFHAVIIRSKGAPDTRSTLKIRLETDAQRREHVGTRLGVRVTPVGVMLPNRAGPNICLIQPNRDVYSETFIRNHAERLPAHVRMLHTGWFPSRREDDSRLLTLPLHLLGGVERSLPNRVRGAITVLREKTLSRYLQRNSINVVLAEYGLTGASVMNACRHARVPLVVHFHGFDAYHLPTLAEYSARYRRMFELASALIAVSRDMEQQLIKLGAPQAKVHYNPYGVDLGLFDGAHPHSSEATFVAVGRFVDKKAPYLTLLAFRTVVSRVPDARLIFLGEGPLLETCKRIAASLHLEGRVEFRGARASAEVADAFRSCRAFVQHSIRTIAGDSEGTPVAVLEAGAAGLPVVATRHAGIKDVVLEGETGFLVDEGDIDAMAHQMIQLAESPSLSGSMGRRARQHIAANFSLEKSIGQLWAILQKAIEEARR